MKSKFNLLFITSIITCLGLVAWARQEKKQAPPRHTQGEDEVVRVDISLVTVPVSVKGRGGKIVPGLRREDFRLYEDGVEQEIAYFEPPEVMNGARPESAAKPLTVALLLDVSDSTEFKLGQIQDAAIGFVDQLRAEDRVIVVAFDRRVRTLAEATSDRGALREAIKRVRSGGGTSLYGALDAVLTHRLSRIGGRKAVVLFTDGVDTTSRGPTEATTIRAAEELDAAVYPVQYNTYGDFADNPSRETYSGLGGTAHTTKNGELASVAYKRATLYLRLLAERTGGRFYNADSPKNLSRSFARIAAELRQQYTLGYYPKNLSADAARRQISVRVNVPEVTVRARESYIYKPPPAR